MQFDIENAAIMLETVNDLLLIYTDFYETECPTKENLKTVSPMDALAFTAGYAERSRTYFCLIDAACDKIRELIAQLNKVINDYLITKNNSVSESNAAYNDVMEKYKHLSFFSDLSAAASVKPSPSMYPTTDAPDIIQPVTVSAVLSEPPNASIKPATKPATATHNLRLVSFRCQSILLFIQNLLCIVYVV